MDLQNRLVYIPTVQLEHHPKNPRTGYNDIDELAESIKVKGVMQNLTVVKNGENKYYVVIGNRRLEAAKKAGLDELPCAVAEMTEQEIVSTMLVENMQRSDLNAYEQAQGIQMMLDLGETVGSIADKTGFSETTVRRRVKLAELDKKKLKKASEERQVSLSDLDKLSEIKDIKTRNKLLDVIGTDSFSYEFRRANDEQIRTEKEKMWRELAKKHNLTEIKKTDRWSGKYTQAGPAKDKKDFEDKIVKGVEFFSPEGGICFLYKKANVAKKPEKSPERIKRDECVSALNAENERMYNSRIEYVKNIKVAEIKGCESLIIKTIVTAALERRLYNVPDRLKAVMGNDDKKDDAAALFKTAYCTFGDSKYFSCHDLNGEYEKSNPLEDVYKFLKACGYTMSEAEEKILSGESELYYHVDPIAKEVKEEIDRLAVFDVNEKLLDNIYKLLKDDNKDALVELVTSCARDKVCYFCGADVKCDRRSPSSKCWKPDEEQIEEDVDNFFEAYHRIKERAILAGKSEMSYGVDAAVDKITDEVKLNIRELPMLDLSDESVDEIYRLLCEENKEELVEFFTEEARKNKECFYCGAECPRTPYSTTDGCWEADVEEIEDGVDEIIDAYHEIKERG